MASIQQVYNTLRDLTNKEQKGFITPRVFNSLAFVAQMNVYNEFFTELVDAKKLSRQGFELGRDKSLKKQKLEDLSYFVKKTTIAASDNVFAKPQDLSKIISIGIHDPIDFGTVSNPCEILYDIDKSPTSWKWQTQIAQPVGPNYSVYTQAGGVDVPNPLSMRDFMLPDHCVPELVSEMAKLLGVRLRDPNIQSFASREETTE